MFETVYSIPLLISILLNLHVITVNIGKYSKKLGLGLYLGDFQGHHGFVCPEDLACISVLHYASSFGSRHMFAFSRREEQCEVI